MLENMDLNNQSDFIENDKISPRLLKSSLFNKDLTTKDIYKLPERVVYDFEIELILDGNGSMVINNKSFPLSKGTIVFRRPGQIAQGIMPYSCYLICIDLLNNTYKETIMYEIHDNNQKLQQNWNNDCLDKIPTVFNVPNFEQYNFLFESVFNLSVTPHLGSDIMLKAYILQILYFIVKDSTSFNITKSNLPPNPHNKAIKKAMNYIDTHIKEKIFLQDLACITELSPSHFHKIFRNNIGITPNEYIIKLKIDIAKEMLSKTNSTISEIALECGFENIPYFSYIFKKYTLTTPGYFRKMHTYYSVPLVKTQFQNSN